MRPKWHGKDWREFTCRECGYLSKFLNTNEGVEYYCRRYSVIDFEETNTSNSIKACPDFEHRDVPDPDERTNLDHIKPEDRQ